MDTLDRKIAEAEALFDFPTGEIEMQPMPRTGSHAPFGPATLPVRKPGGIFDPPFAAEPTEHKEWVDLVDEELVLCNTCKFGWKMLKYAPVLNYKPDGSPYMAREGYCMYPAGVPGGAPLPLEERFVIECNRHKREE